jgi:DNA-directed RNA polymerase specialized sigma24 family protein
LSERDNRRGLDSLRQLSDEELARVAARGDEAAARVLLERFEEPLYRYTVALVRDPDLAREATWSALFEAARAVRSDEYSDPVAPWIFRVAHTAADVAGGRPEGSRPTDDDAAARAAAGSGADRERHEALLAGLDALPDRDRSSLLLRELVGLEYVGIATVTGARAAAARQSVYRARTALHGEDDLPTPHCTEIRAAMSKAESGVRERRSIAMHLETCESCERFAAALASRPDDFRTLFPGPTEPLAAELVPPLPPVTSGAGARTGFGAGGGRGLAGASLGGRDRGGSERDRPARRRGSLVPIVLVLLLIGAAIATALALNDNGGGKKGKAAAAPGAQARGPAGAKGSGKASSGKSKAGAKSGSSKSGGGKARSVPPAKPKGGAPSGSKGAVPGATGSAGNSASGGSKSSGTRAERPCRTGPAAAPAQSGYSDRAGAVQAEVQPCARSSRAEAGGGLANTGLDVALVIATGFLLLALGASLRRLNSNA